MKKAWKASALNNLMIRGFDESYAKSHSVRVKCSQCQATVINGTAVHEYGCPNDTHECAGCWDIIPTSQKYCESCG